MGVDLVTGAFGNTGSAIAALLRARGRDVRTLTSHPDPQPDQSPPGASQTARQIDSQTDSQTARQIDVRSYSWNEPERLAQAFEGVDTFYNTYWMRLGDSHRGAGAGGYDTAADRCIEMIDAAEAAGVSRIVHLSVAHPSRQSPYPYFRGKARVEERLAAGSTPSTAVRPALIFGGHSVLINNLAWLLRKLPVFAVPGDGRYRVRPVHVEDVAGLCVSAGSRPRHGDLREVGLPGETQVGPSLTAVDAVGPERPTYLELVHQVRSAVGARTAVVKAPVAGVLLGGRLLGALVHDDVLDRDELVSTMEGLADTEGPPTGSVSLAAWLTDHGAELGTAYRNERSART